MGLESYANLKKEGIIWINGQGSLYAAMALVTFFLIDIEIRSGVELITYIII